MSNVAHHLVRRAFDATQQYHANSQASPSQGDGDHGHDPLIKPIAVWGVIILWATILMFIAFIAMVNYTFGEVVGTLTMIETPTATAYKLSEVEDEAVDSDAPLLSQDQKDEKARLKSLEQELLIVDQAPITAKIRTAVRHIVSVGGFWARFRGFHVALIANILHEIAIGVFAPTARGFGLRKSIVSVIATVLLCHFLMAWTHIVISNPSPKRWFRRLPSNKMAFNALLPTTIYAIAVQAVLWIPLGFSVIIADHLNQPEKYNKSRETMQKIAIVETFLYAIVSIATALLILIPAEVTLKRVQASMLPEEDESIVPFDRTFGGRVKPQILGGSGAVGMLDAWRSFDKKARLRLIKLYLKIFGIQTATIILFVATILGELRLIMGREEFTKAGILLDAKLRYGL